MVLPPFPDEESEEEKLSFTQFRLSFRASIFSSSSILARVAGSGDFSFLAYEGWGGEQDWKNSTSRFSVRLL